MSKGGSPMGGGGFGGQQQGFGGGFGGPQGGFGGGFGGQQGGFGGFGGGYQPSRQRFNQMPQQQMGYGGGFGGQMQGFGMPQQQQGFGNTFARTMPPQQDFGGYGMPQQQQGYGGGFGGQMGFGMPQQRQQDMFMPRVSQMAPQDFQSQAASQAAALQSMGMPQSEGGMDAGMGEYNRISAERNMAARAAQANQPPATASQLGNMLRGSFQQQANQMMQPVLGQPGGNLVGGGQQPMMQQVRQEDPRMQAMRMIQQMRFGNSGGGRF